MNKKFFIIYSFCWTVLFIGLLEITDWVFESEWIFEKNWHHTIVILGWYVYGCLSVSFFTWYDKQKKQLNGSKKK